MNKLAGEKAFDFTLAVGDNFYFKGVRTEYSQRFITTFENIFSGNNLMNMPFYVVAGNHDHYGNVTAQIEYHNLSPRWNFPNFWYTFTKHIPNSQATVQFVMIDTILLSRSATGYKRHHKSLRRNRRPFPHVELDLAMKLDSKLATQEYLALQEN